MAGYGDSPFGGQPGHQGRDWTKIAIIGGGALVAIILVAIVAVTAGSGGQSADPATAANPSRTPTVAVETPTEAAPTPTSQNPAPVPTTAAPPSSTAEDDNPPLTATVPNVVGKDLQSAQEELFPPLRSTSVDATGQGRSQIVDSNWVVVRQEPAAGTTVPVFTDVKLFVVKSGESAR